MPSIGVSASNAEEAQPYQQSVDSRGATTRAILPGGGLPAEDIIQESDAFLLSAGPDIDPELYNQTPNPRAS